MINRDEELLKVKKIIVDNLEVDLSLDLLSKEIRTRRSFQHLSLLKPKEKSTRVLLEMILNYSFQAETKCPQSGVLFLKQICGDKIDEKLRKIPKNRGDVLEILKSRQYTDVVNDLLEQSLILSSSNTKLALKKTSSQSAFIELSEGFSFDLSLSIKSTINEARDVKVACIDGYVETVSEIHHLLSYLSESGSTCLLVARGFSNDVLSTLKVNNDRKTLSVFPYLSPFDVDNVNTLVDIAVASGTDVTSTTKGNLISSLNPENLGNFNHCLFYPTVIRAKSRSKDSSLKNHLENLKNKLEERPEIAEILGKRVKSLSSSCLDICIPDDINFFYNSSQLDEGIRIISSIMNNTYDPYSVSNLFYRSFKENFQKCSFLL